MRKSGKVQEQEQEQEREQKQKQDRLKVKPRSRSITTSSIDTDHAKEKIKGKKFVVLFVVTILLSLLISQILYLYVIPRVTLDVRTVYHEATGGGGTGGLINVNSKIINSGTVEARGVEISVKLLNSNKSVLVNKSYYQNILSPGESHELKLITNGNCYEDYYIIVEIQFETSNSEFIEKYNYKTHEDVMNIGFEDSIFQWGS